jgi:hypothetical protein
MFGMEIVVKDRVRKPGVIEAGLVSINGREVALTRAGMDQVIIEGDPGGIQAALGECEGCPARNFFDITAKKTGRVICWPMRPIREEVSCRRCDRHTLPETGVYTGISGS